MLCIFGMRISTAEAFRLALAYVEYGASSHKMYGYPYQIPAMPFSSSRGVVLLVQRFNLMSCVDLSLEITHANVRAVLIGVDKNLLTTFGEYAYCTYTFISIYLDSCTLDNGVLAQE